MKQKKGSCPGCNEKQPFEQIANIIDLYSDKPGSLIQVLHTVQNLYGCLPLEVQKIIADGMGIPLSEVSGVVSFYSFFSTTPKGDHTIRVCMGTACYVRGGKKILESLTQTLGVAVGGTTEDGRFTVEVARCIGACGLAPSMMIDDKVFKQVSPTKLGSILAAYEKTETLDEGGEAS